MYVQVYAGNKRKEIKVFENQVSDVKWSPSGENFIVISGKMPATCTVYTKDCVPKFEFGKLYMNTVKYSPHDDLVLLGGFKSLAGDLLFWDKQDISNIHLIGKNNSHSSIQQEWSPDSRYFMTAVTHPRVRVENELSIFNNYGERVFYERLPEGGEMYFAFWQPVNPSVYSADRPVP